MANEYEDSDVMEDGDEESVESNSVWGVLTPEQKKYFKKLNEKTPDKMKYIG